MRPCGVLGATATGRRATFLSAALPQLQGARKPLRLSARLRLELSSQQAGTQCLPV